ncbi:MAG: MBL fold metallo-hydrolase [Phycisphaerae bacterium]|jgi:hydroxyacylglutathione hydrolase|nr:MBL fold metallo-hydrolase [Phycisphaerae bacterium]
MTTHITPFVLGNYQTNCHVVTSGTDCWVVDCGYEPDELIAYLNQTNLIPSAILLTHCHADHIAGLDQMRDAIGEVPVLCHESEAEWNMNPTLNLSGFAGMPITAKAPNGFLTPGKQITLGDSVWEVLHAPGHSPGSICFVNYETNQAIVGDTLFAGSIGRHDFPTSNVEDLRHSISEVLMSLPDETAIFPGHGPSSTIGHERATNPFILHGF